MFIGVPSRHLGCRHDPAVPVGHAHFNVNCSRELSGFPTRPFFPALSAFHDLTAWQPQVDFWPASPIRGGHSDRCRCPPAMLFATLSVRRRRRWRRSARSPWPAVSLRITRLRRGDLSAMQGPGQPRPPSIMTVVPARRHERPRWASCSRQGGSGDAPSGGDRDGDQSTSSRRLKLPAQLPPRQLPQWLQPPRRAGGWGTACYCW